MADSLLGKFGYAGIILLLVLGGLGLPVPEEAPIIGAAMLSRHGKMLVPVALASCFVGVLVGDFIVYAMGYFYGEKVLRFPITRKFLTRERKAQMKGYFHRHGIRILITGRFVPGFRTAAYLTAGILRLPPLKLFLADLFAATLSTLLMFSLGFFFASWVELHWKKTQGYLVIVVGLAVAAFLLHRFYKARQRGGAIVGPPVPISNEVPLPVDDLHSGIYKFPKDPQPEPIIEPPMVAEVIQVDTTAAEVVDCDEPRRRRSWRWSRYRPRRPGARFELLRRVLCEHLLIRIKEVLAEHPTRSIRRRSFAAKPEIRYRRDLNFLAVPTPSPRSCPSRPSPRCDRTLTRPAWTTSLPRSCGRSWGARSVAALLRAVPWR